jgi:hypothetical protein
LTFCVLISRRRHQRKLEAVYHWRSQYTCQHTSIQFSSAHSIITMRLKCRNICNFSTSNAYIFAQHIGTCTLPRRLPRCLNNCGFSTLSLPYLVYAHAPLCDATHWSQILASNQQLIEQQRAIIRRIESEASRDTPQDASTSSSFISSDASALQDERDAKPGSLTTKS